MRFAQTLSLFSFFIQSVFSQSFLSFEPIPAPLIEWDQPNTTYYTGQTIQMNWTSQNFLSSDLARIQYVGAGGTRTLTTGSGTSIQGGTYSVRLSDSANGVASSVPLTIAHATNTANSLSSTTRITVIQSRLINIIPLDGTRTLGGGQTAVCDNRNLTVTWRGLGEAQFGVATVTLRRQSGFSGTQTLATVNNILISGNTSIDLFCSRSVTPSTSNSYGFEISVQKPGGSSYTGTSPTFNFLTAPSPSPSSSITPTSSITPSPTPSVTPSPSFSQTPTPSVSTSNTPTPSTTPTANPSIDYAGIARAAAESVDTQTPAIAGALGGIGGILVLVGVWRWYEKRELTKKRLLRLQMTSRFVKEANSVYGMAASRDIQQEPGIVMYSVQGLPPRSTESKQLTSMKKGFAPKSTSK